MLTVDAWAGALALLAALPAGDRDELPLDRVELKDGKTHEGRVLFESPTELVVRVGKREMRLAQDETAAVHANLRNLPAGLDMLGRFADAGPEQLLAVADRLDELALPREAHLVRWLVLDKDPANDRAHEILGHKRRKDEWLVQSGRKWVSLEKRRELASEFRSGWEFDTTHYALRTNLGLAQALDLAFELERLYRAFYELFRVDFEVYEITEPMEVAAYADRKSYPAKGAYAVGMAEAPGLFTPETNVLFLDASERVALWILAHEGTEQLLHNAARERRRGSVPEWLNEAFGQYMLRAAGSDADEIALQEDRAWPELFRIHAQARDPFGINRLLNFSSNDLVRPEDWLLMRAEAYSLVHFCLHGANERYRAGFSEYVRAMYEGRATSSFFFKALGQRERELEPLWLEHARALAGP